LNSDRAGYCNDIIDVNSSKLLPGAANRAGDRLRVSPGHPTRDNQRNISATSAQHQRSHAGPAQARYAASGSAHICDLIADLQRALAVLRAMV